MQLTKNKTKNTYSRSAQQAIYKMSDSQKRQQQKSTNTPISSPEGNCRLITGVKEETLYNFRIVQDIYRLIK